MVYIEKKTVPYTRRILTREFNQQAVQMMIDGNSASSGLVEPLSIAMIDGGGTCHG